MADSADKRRQERRFLTDWICVYGRSDERTNCALLSSSECADIEFLVFFRIFFSKRDPCVDVHIVFYVTQ